MRQGERGYLFWFSCLEKVWKMFLPGCALNWTMVSRFPVKIREYAILRYWLFTSLKTLMRHFWYNLCFFITCFSVLSHYCDVFACSVAQLCSTLWDHMDYSHQDLLSIGFSRQEYWSGLPWPAPGDLPDPGIKSASPALALSHLGSHRLWSVELRCKGNFVQNT